jgi:hypothetical protein
MQMTHLRTVSQRPHIGQTVTHRGPGAETDFDSGLPHTDPHPQPPPGDHGPDPDEPVDKTESGEEP